MQRALPQTSVKSSSYWPWLMLFSRLGLFIAFQALFALGFWLVGVSSAWGNAAAWWPFTVTFTNIVCVLALITLFKADGANYWRIFQPRRETLKGDLLALAGALVLLGPISYLPNILLANWLFGDAQITLNLMIRPLPLWAAYAGIALFPITQGLAELATYFMFAMPRFELQGMPRWQAVTLASLMLALQHVGVPFLFDTRYLIWRSLMFVPFAFMVGILLRWRPSLLPYLAIIHVLMDVAFAVMLLNAAY